MIPWLEPWMAIPGMLLVHFGLSRLAKSNTAVGRRLAASEHEAWRYAVDSKERELRELLAAEPRGEK